MVKSVQNSKNMCMSFKLRFEQNLVMSDFTYYTEKTY